MRHSGFLGLRSLLFNVGWYAGTTVIAIVGVVVVLDDDPDEEPVIIHAMPLRAKFLPYLR